MSAKNLHAGQLTRLEKADSGPYQVTLAKTEIGGRRKFGIHIKPTRQESTGKSSQEAEAFRLLGFEAYEPCAMTKGACYSRSVAEFSALEPDPHEYAKLANVIFASVKEHFGDTMRLLMDAARSAEQCGLSFWRSRP